MQELIAVGVSHKTAPLSVRERLALPGVTSGHFLAELRGHDEIREAVVLSTCNRTEVYVVAADPVAAETAVLASLAQRAGIRPSELLDPVYSLRNCDAARHLFRVTAGLDSMIVGETEIQGQVKRAYDDALAAGSTGTLTNRLFRVALATGKRARSETGISAGAASVPSLAVDAASRRLGDLSTKRVLILGAGETSELVARALAEEGVQTLFIANRRIDRARALADRYGGSTASFDRLPEELVLADILIASTASPHSILGAAELDQVIAVRDGRPLLLLDLAVPRDIEADCGLLRGVTLFDMDALQAQVAVNRSGRQLEAERAEAIIEQEITTFASWLGSLEALPTVGALRSHGSAIVEQVLADNDGRWESLSARDRERVEAIARSVMNRLLHEPTLAIKRAGPNRLHGRMQLVRELFGLDQEDGAAPAGRADAEVRAGEPPPSPDPSACPADTIAEADAPEVAWRRPVTSPGAAGEPQEAPPASSRQADEDAVVTSSGAAGEPRRPQT